MKQFVIHIWPKIIPLKIQKESIQTFLHRIQKETIQCPHSSQIATKQTPLTAHTNLTQNRHKSYEYPTQRPYKTTTADYINSIKNPHRANAEPTQNSNITHTDPGQNPHRSLTKPTQTLDRTHTDPWQNPHRLWTGPTQNSHRTHTDPEQNPHRTHTETITTYISKQKIAS